MVEAILAFSGVVVCRRAGVVDIMTIPDQKTDVTVPISVSELGFVGVDTRFKQAVAVKKLGIVLKEETKNVGTVYFTEFFSQGSGKGLDFFVDRSPYLVKNIGKNPFASTRQLEILGIGPDHRFGNGFGGSNWW